MSKDKKKFKDTAVGKFINNNVPEALEALDGIPAVSTIKGVLKLAGVNLPKDKQEEFDAALAEYEKEIYALEIQDRESARHAEVERLQAGSQNLTQNILAYVGVVAFFAMIGYILSKGLGDMNTEESFVIGNLTGLAGAIAKDIYGYYFGSSKGSADKTRLHEATKHK